MSETNTFPAERRWSGIRGRLSWSIRYTPGQLKVWQFNFSLLRKDIARKMLLLKKRVR